MYKNIFQPADILIPKTPDFESWSVIACDQYSSDKEYWMRVEDKTREKPSTFHMIVPEAFLDNISMPEASRSKHEIMEKYWNSGMFATLPNSFVYVEREVTGGFVRHGIVGVIDLEAYEYTPGNSALIRASENTVVDRLPPRIAVRSSALLELPHIMVLLDDAEKSVIEPISEHKNELEPLYDFELMENGGRLKGWQVSGEAAEKVMSAINAIEKPFLLVIGDGNHSLAAAKCCWENIKKETGLDTHPARYALVEMNNVYDEGIVFEPIHRVIFGTNIEKFVCALKEKIAGKSGWRLEYRAKDSSGAFCVEAENVGNLIDKVQKFVEAYISENGGTVDYIHDLSAVSEFTTKSDTVGILMPPMDKSELFKTVAENGVFPKKSFSIGHAKDKRYYLECRKIR